MRRPRQSALSVKGVFDFEIMGVLQIQWAVRDRGRWEWAAAPITITSCYNYITYLWRENRQRKLDRQASGWESDADRELYIILSEIVGEGQSVVSACKM